MWKYFRDNGEKKFMKRFGNQHLKVKGYLKVIRFADKSNCFILVCNIISTSNQKKVRAHKVHMSEVKLVKPTNFYISSIFILF